MRVIVYGAGAIGGVIGGRLFEHGTEVVLIARGAHHDAIRERGLRLDTPGVSVTLPVPVVSRPAEVAFGDDDVVMLAMKGQDTDAAVAALAAAAPPETPVVCAQNGVDNERRALRLFPNVYGMVVMCPASHLEPGAVVASSEPVTGILDVGRYPAGVDATAEVLAATLVRATFASEPRADIMRWKYRKLVMNLGNAVDALCGMEARQGDLGRMARREGEAVLAAAGIDLVSREEDRARRGDLLQLRPVDGQRRVGSSSAQSLARGTGTIESDHLNGEIVLLGRLHGVPTPVNEALQREARRAAVERRPPGSMTENELLSVLGTSR
jgi:2-dehydropantoate 2-reductase